MGYGKRITFKPDTLNAPENYFWSDSHPEGIGMEPRAVHPDMKFSITGNGVSFKQLTTFTNRDIKSLIVYGFGLLPAKDRNYR